MLIYQNAEGVHGQRKFGNPWARAFASTAPERKKFQDSACHKLRLSKNGSTDSTSVSDARSLQGQATVQIQSRSAPVTSGARLPSGKSMHLLQLFSFWTVTKRCEH